MESGHRSLAIVGAGGTGKSALMARAIQQTQEMHPQAEIVYRFIGATPQELAFTPSTSFGFHVIAQMLKARGISEVLTLETEFPSTTLPMLYDGLALRAVRMRADGTYGRLLGQLARMDVLVLDDFALVPLQDPERRDLLEILEDRYGTRSTIVTSQLAPPLWHEAIGDPTLADAICDRLLHNSHRLMLKGPSRRKEDKLER